MSESFFVFCSLSLCLFSLYLRFVVICFSSNSIILVVQLLHNAAVDLEQADLITLDSLEPRHLNFDQLFLVG